MFYFVTMQLPVDDFLRFEFRELGSTQQAARALAFQFPGRKLAVRAHRQTAGRGQRGSAWLSAPGKNLTASWMLYPDALPVSVVFLLNMVASLAVTEWLKQQLPTSAELQIKWPNDILVDGKKIAGILIETQLQKRQISSACVGIGLNVGQEEFSGSFSRAPTSLKLLQVHTSEALLAEAFEVIGSNLLKGLQQATRKGFRSLYPTYAAQLFGLGQWRPFQLLHPAKPPTNCIGRIESVVPSGELVVEIDGAQWQFAFKEIRQL